MWVCGTYLCVSPMSLLPLLPSPWPTWPTTLPQLLYTHHTTTPDHRFPSWLLYTYHTILYTSRTLTTKQMNGSCSGYIFPKSSPSVIPAKCFLVLTQPLIPNFKETWPVLKLGTWVLVLVHKAGPLMTIYASLFSLKRWAGRIWVTFFFKWHQYFFCCE